MPVRLITAPALEPVTLQEAKNQLRLETADDDVLVAALVKAARERVEEDTSRGLVTQTWELVQNSFAGVDTLELGYRGRQPYIGFGPNFGATATPSGSLPWIELPKGVVASVTSVKYIDTLGAEQTLSASVYTVDMASVPARLMLAYGQAYPNTRPQWDAVVIRYVVGTAVANVPQALKQAILIALTQMYENRSPVLDEIGSTYDALIGGSRIIRL